MDRTRIAAWIRREDYDAFVRLIRDEGFPDTFDAWLKLKEDTAANEEAHGAVVQKVIVDPEEFARYCRAIGAPPSEDSLQMYAIRIAQKMQR